MLFLKRFLHSKIWCIFELFSSNASFTLTENERKRYIAKVFFTLEHLTRMCLFIMPCSHWTTPRTRARQIARPIEMGHIEFYERCSQYQWCHWLRYLISLFIGLGVLQCEHTINDSCTPVISFKGSSRLPFWYRLKVGWIHSYGANYT